MLCRGTRSTQKDVYWFEWHGVDAPQGVKLPDSARAICTPPNFVVALTVTVANVTGVPPSWPRLLAGLLVNGTQSLPKQVVIGLDVTCGSTSSSNTSTTQLRPTSQPAVVPAGSGSAPAPAPVLAPASAPGPSAPWPLKPGQPTSPPTITLPGVLTIDPAQNRTSTMHSTGPGYQITGFARMATVAGTWGWVSDVQYPEPHGLVSGSSMNSDAGYYGDYGANDALVYDVTWLDVCPSRTRIVGVEVLRRTKLLLLGLTGLRIIQSLCCSSAAL